MRLWDKIFCLLIVGIGLVESKRHKSKRKSDKTLPSNLTPLSKELPAQIEEYRRRLYPEYVKEDSQAITKILRNQSKNPKWRRKGPLIVHWDPVECYVLGLDLETVKAIREGSRNQVYLLRERKTGKEYVWKVYASPDEYTSEFSFLSVADHPNIVKPVCIEEQPDPKSGLSKPGLVIEYVSGGQLHDYLHDHPDEYKRVMAQIYDVVKYMHWLGYIHADLKPQNIMVDGHGKVVAIDFGFAIRSHLPGKLKRGTPSTNSPELMSFPRDARIKENIDHWAFGPTAAQAYNSIMKVMPHIRVEEDRKHRWTPIRISKRDYLFGKVPEKFPKDLRQLLYYCLNPNPQERRWVTKEQLEWFESLPFWDGIDFDTIGYNWKLVE